MSRVLVAAAGTLGDLHPLLAIARALEAAGIKPVFAVSEDHAGVVAAAGFEAIPAFEGLISVRRRLEARRRSGASKLVRSQRAMLEHAVLADLAAATRTLDLVATRYEVRAVVGSNLVPAAPIVAEKRALPFVAVVLQPMAMLSALDPPATPDFRLMRKAPVGTVGAAWNRAVYSAMRRVLNRRYGALLDDVRGQHGLAPQGAAGMFEPMREAALTLGLYSAAFAPVMPDAPPGATATGFPSFDEADPEPFASLLADFMEAGSPPIVFTLGSFVASDAPASTTRPVRRRAGRGAARCCSPATGGRLAAKSTPSRATTRPMRPSSARPPSWCITAASARRLRRCAPGGRS